MIRAPTTHERSGLSGGWKLPLRWYVVVGAFVLLLLAAGVYSIAIKRWCEQYERGWAGEQVWGAGDFDDKPSRCIREKSIFSF